MLQRGCTLCVMTSSLLALAVLLLCVPVHGKLCTESPCTYTFDVRWETTMTHHDAKTGESRIVMSHNGQLVMHNENGESVPVNPDEVLIGDGQKRKVITINGQFPGPTIEVMVHSKVQVTVHNHLPEALSIHWHGMHLVGEGEVWMDGVANITQCPVPPSASFTYVFTAFPSGVHWYHSHALNQRTDGLYGLLLVRRLPEAPAMPFILSQLYQYTAAEVRAMEQEIPELEQHRMHSSGHHGSLLPFQHHSPIINGRGRWVMDDAAIPWYKVRFTPGIVLDVVHAGGDFGLKVSVDGHTIVVLSMDGFDIEPVEVDMFYIYPGETLEVTLVNTTEDADSVWIRVKEIMLHEMSPEHDHTIDIPQHEPSNDTPKQGVMNADIMEMHHIGEPPKQHIRTGRASQAATTKQEHSMDGQNNKLDHIREATKVHRFQVSDDKEKRSVDGSHTTDTGHSDGNGTDSEGRGLHSMEGRAILFHGTSEADYNGQTPTTTERDCAAKTCRVFNCPGPSMNQAETCVLLTDIKGKASTNAEFWRKLDLHHDADESHVINFMLSGHPHAPGSTANGKKFIVPDVPMYSKKARKNDCSACEKCGHCTNIITLPAGKVVQLTFANLQSEQPLYMHHPIHLHGYAFAIMKVAYPTMGESGLKPASGIKCLSKFCEQVERSEGASEESEHGGAGHEHDVGSGQTMSFPHRHQRNTQAMGYRNSTAGLRQDTRLLYKRHTSAGMEVVMKNTILVPAKGYVDVRIFTDNPGFWFIHCHVDLHLLKGMAALIEVLPQVPPPNEFPTCGNEILPYTRIPSKGCSQGLSTSYQIVGIIIITLINLTVHL